MARQQSTSDPGQSHSTIPFSYFDEALPPTPYPTSPGDSTAHPWIALQPRESPTATHLLDPHEATFAHVASSAPLKYDPRACSVYMGYSDDTQSLHPSSPGCDASRQTGGQDARLASPVPAGASSFVFSSSGHRIRRPVQTLVQAPTKWASDADADADATSRAKISSELKRSLPKRGKAGFKKQKAVMAADGSLWNPVCAACAAGSHATTCDWAKVGKGDLNAICTSCSSEGVMDPQYCVKVRRKPAANQYTKRDGKSESKSKSKSTRKSTNTDPTSKHPGSEGTEAHKVSATDSARACHVNASTATPSTLPAPSHEDPETPLWFPSRENSEVSTKASLSFILNSSVSHRLYQEAYGVPSDTSYRGQPP